MDMNSKLTIHVSKDDFARYQELKLIQMQEELVPVFLASADYYKDHHQVEQLSWAASTQLRTKKYDLDAIDALLDKLLDQRLERLRSRLLKSAHLLQSPELIAKFSDKSKPITEEDLKHMRNLLP